jgi:hypothetical protein
MKTNISFLIVAVFLCSFQQVKLVKTKVNDAITIYLPQDFTAMSSADIERGFESAKLPVAEYTDFSRAVDLGINVAYSQWNPEDLEIMRSFYKSNILGLYDEVQFIKEDTEEINGRIYAVFEFISSVYDDDDSINMSPVSKYTRIQYTIVKGKTVLFNFTAPAREREKWEPVANQILQSVKISKTL